MKKPTLKPRAISWWLCGFDPSGAVNKKTTNFQSWRFLMKNLLFWEIRRILMMTRWRTSWESIGPERSGTHLITLLMKTQRRIVCFNWQRGPCANRSWMASIRLCLRTGRLALARRTQCSEMRRSRGLCSKRCESCLSIKISIKTESTVFAYRLWRFTTSRSETWSTSHRTTIVLLLRASRKTLIETKSNKSTSWGRIQSRVCKSLT